MEPFEYSNGYGKPVTSVRTSPFWSFDINSLMPQTQIEASWPVLVDMRFRHWLLLYKIQKHRSGILLSCNIFSLTWTVFARKCAWASLPCLISRTSVIYTKRVCSFADFVCASRHMILSLSLLRKKYRT